MNFNFFVLFYYKDNLFFMLFIVIRFGNMIVEFYLVMDRDVIFEDIVNVSFVLVNFRRFKISVRFFKYNILREFIVGIS